RRMTVDDGLVAETTFEMLMGNAVGPRKDFIIDGAYQLDAAAIDA
ncbi:MAG: type topoisomerase, partial [Propionibacteriaceae bacterium]|nr:type topoisomerase [Propionibacteriaceae bacterium]